MPKRLRVGLVGTAGLIVALGLAGTGFEAFSARRDADRYPPAGQMVDVGGSRMHISCTGSGSPTVILDAGLSGSSLDWGLVQPAIATSTRVCSYDRAGMGWSDPVPQVRSPAQIARELHTLLTEATITPPYVLVGHSLAGKNIRMFAIQHPDEVAGMVLVDARSEVVDEQASEGEVTMTRVAAHVQGWAYRFARRVGLARLSGASLLGYSAFGGDVGKVMALKVTGSDAVATSTREMVERSSSDGELRAAPSFGDMPLVVLASDHSMSSIAFWPEGQSSLAALSARGRLILVEGSGHYIHIERPAEVLDAIREVTVSARLRASASTTSSGATAP